MEHPLEIFKYCPVCGSEHFEVHNFKSKKCCDCGFTYYANPCSATAAFIVNDNDEMLVVRRAKEPAKGTLDLPGGFVDMGETVEEGMVREIKEETNLDVSVGDFCEAIQNDYSHKRTVQIMMYLENIEGEVKISDEHTDWKWATLEEIKTLNISTSLKKLLKKRNWEI